MKKDSDYNNQNPTNPTNINNIRNTEMSYSTILNPNTNTRTPSLRNNPY